MPKHLDASLLNSQDNSALRHGQSIKLPTIDNTEMGESFTNS